jgi:hypothetical protein
MMRRFLTLAALVVMSIGVAQADWLGLENGSFEDPNSQVAVITNASDPQTIPVDSGAFAVFTGTGVPGWTAGSEGLEIQNMGAADGTQHVELDTHGEMGLPGEYEGHNSSMSQDFTVQSGDAGVFQLSLSYRIHESLYDYNGAAAGLGSDPMTGGYSTYAVAVYIDGNLLHVFDDPSATNWTTMWTSEFQILAGDHTITFAALGFGDTFGGLLDLISLNRVGDVGEIPEPATVILVGAGLAGLFFVRRRRQNA